MPMHTATKLEANRDRAGLNTVSYDATVQGTPLAGVSVTKKINPMNRVVSVEVRVPVKDGKLTVPTSSMDALARRAEPRIPVNTVPTYYRGKQFAIREFVVLPD